MGIRRSTCIFVRRSFDVDKQPELKSRKRDWYRNLKYRCCLSTKEILSLLTINNV